MKERQTSVSDLLALRDGEPLDGVRAVDASRDPQQVERLNRLIALKQDLKSLPVLNPDAGNLARIRARLEVRRPARWQKVLLASAALVTLGTLVSFRVLEEEAEFISPAQVAAVRETPSAPAGTQATVPRPATDLEALRRVSFRLEGLARALPAGSPQGDPVESALLYRLADLDGQLVRSAEADPQDIEAERTLWARRVELLGTLTRVRQIQATRQVASY